MTRIDVRPDGSGCNSVWNNPVRSITVPKLSIRDGNIYTVERTMTGSSLQYSFLSIDFATGKALGAAPIGHSYELDAFQLAGMIGRQGTYYQPTLTAMIHVQPTTKGIDPAEEGTGRFPELVSCE